MEIVERCSGPCRFWLLLADRRKCPRPSAVDLGKAFYKEPTAVNQTPDPQSCMRARSVSSALVSRHPELSNPFLSTRIANASEFERGTRRERETLDEWIDRNPSTKVSSSSSCCPLTNHPASAANEGSCQCSFLDPTLSRCGRVFRDPKPVWALCTSSRLGVPEPNGQHGGPGCVRMPGPAVFFIDVYGVHETSYRARHARTVPSSHRQSNQSSSSMPCLPKELDFGGQRKGAPLRR